MTYFLAAVRVLVIIIGVSLFLAAGFHILRRFNSKQDSKKRNEDARQASNNFIRLDKEALRQFAESAYRMEGVLEAMHRLGTGNTENKNAVISDWSSRISGMPNAQHLRQIWETISKGFEAWSDAESTQFAKNVSHSWIFEDGSFERDGRNKLIIEQSTGAEYIMDNGKKLEPNSKALVLWPCWKCKGNIVEKGTLREVKD